MGWENVRHLVGYDRFEGAAAYRQLAELYRDRPVLLLHVALVVLPVGRPPRKGDVLLAAVGQQLGVQEFAPVVRVETQQGHRQQLKVQNPWPLPKRLPRVSLFALKDPTR